MTFIEGFLGLRGCTPVTHGIVQGFESLWLQNLPVALCPFQSTRSIDHVSSDLPDQAASSRAPKDLYLKGGGARQGAGEPGFSPGSTFGLRCRRSTPHIFLGSEAHPIIMKL